MYFVFSRFETRKPKEHVIKVIKPLKDLFSLNMMRGLLIFRELYCRGGWEGENLCMGRWGLAEEDTGKWQKPDLSSMGT